MPARGVRAIIVDDEALIVSVIEDALAKIGVIVVGRAFDGKSAVSLCATTKPDIVFMDIEMPELNGIEAARQIQDSVPTPVIVLTAHTDADFACRSADAGVAGYLIKPPNPGDIERAVLIARARFKDLMELRRLNQELRDALAKIKTLQGLLPVCAWCKKIRNDTGYWQSVEEYISAHADVEFSHGICPDCKANLSK